MLSNELCVKLESILKQLKVSGGGCGSGDGGGGCGSGGCSGGDGGGGCGGGGCGGGDASGSVGENQGECVPRNNQKCRNPSRVSGREGGGGI